MNDKEPGTITEVMVRMAGHALVAGAAMNLDTSGPMLGAAATVLFDAAAKADRRAMQHLDGLAKAAADDAGMTPNEVLSWATADDRRMSLVRDVVNAALTTLDQTKASALGAVLATAFKDDAALDGAPMIVAAIRDMDPIHVRVLRCMLFEDNPFDPAVNAPIEGKVFILAGRRWHFAALREHLPNAGTPLINVLATLERHGLIVRDVGASSTYMPTGFVVDVLKFLAAADPPEPMPSEARPLT